MQQPAPPAPRLGLHLALGALMLLAAAWTFGAIAEDVVTGDRITLVDARIAQWLHEHASAGLTRWMLLATDLHSTIAVSCYSAVAATFFVRGREWRRLVTLAVCLAGGLALNVAMKLAFHRARPTFDQPLLTLSSYSFPSGHVVGSTIMYGLAVAWVFTRTPRFAWRALAIGAAAVAIALVAFTRLYLGVHYLSDVGAAFLEGVAWLTLCLSALSEYWRRSDARGRQSP
jgi:membrane-associated phospholipid phosphatase